MTKRTYPLSYKYSGHCPFHMQYILTSPRRKKTQELQLIFSQLKVQCFKIICIKYKVFFLDLKMREKEKLSIANKHYISKE